MGRPDDLPYMVEQWDDADRYVEELIALTGDYGVARVAFAEAARRRPGRIVTLRQEAISHHPSVVVKAEGGCTATLKFPVGHCLQLAGDRA